MDSFSWNEENGLLAAIVDGWFVTWYYPATVFIDKDIEQDTKYYKEMEDGLRQGKIVGFCGTRCLIRKNDGSEINVGGISQFSVSLVEIAKKKQWNDAVKFCRYLKVNL